MKIINEIKFGIAVGLTSLIFHFGCALIMLLLGNEVIIKMSNLLFHGMDFTNIMRENISISDTLFGAVLGFVIWGFLGYAFAKIYKLLNNG